MRAASALMPTPSAQDNRRREESRHGTDECVRYGNSLKLTPLFREGLLVFTVSTNRESNP
jgi:hypothetical protein